MTWYKMDVGRGGGAIKKNPSGYLHVGYMAASGLSQPSQVVGRDRKRTFPWMPK